MIRIENLSKKFDSTLALDGLNMNVPSGSVYGLVGTNGAGKTTIIKHLAGVLRQNSGTIQYDDEDIWENEALKSRIGVIHDELYFPSGYSLKDMRKMYKSAYPKWNDERFHEMTRIMKLDETIKRYYETKATEIEERLETAQREGDKNALQECLFESILIGNTSLMEKSVNAGADITGDYPNNRKPIPISAGLVQGIIQETLQKGDSFAPKSSLVLDTFNRLFIEQAEQNAIKFQEKQVNGDSAAKFLAEQGIPDEEKLQAARKEAQDSYYRALAAGGNSNFTETAARIAEQMAEGVKGYTTQAPRFTQ